MENRLKTPFMFLLILLVALFVLMGTAGAAVTGKILGRVVDTNGSPIPGAGVVVESKRLGGITDPEGRYFILQIPPGRWTVVAKLVGYQSIRQANVVVNVDRTTTLDFQLKDTTIEVDAITIVATRPIVQQDVTSGQMSVTAQKAEELPVSTMLEAISFLPGVSADKMNINVRGSSPDEVMFQVDGFEQSNPLEARSYVAMNQALVQEVQILTGAFSAEYFNRAAVVNVVTREPGRQPRLFLSASYKPAVQKHFGPGAYGDKSFDNLVFMSLNQSDLDDRTTTYDAGGRVYNVLPGNRIHIDGIDYTQTDQVNSNLPVYLASFDGDSAYFTWNRKRLSGKWRQLKANELFIGWDSLTIEANNKRSTYGSKDPLVFENRGWFTKESLIDIWKWRHRPHEYANTGDHYIDVALTTPIYLLKNTGITVGIKNDRSALMVPAVVDAFRDQKYEVGITSSVIPNIKFQVRGKYEKILAGANGSTKLGTSSDHVGPHDSNVNQDGSSIRDSYLNSFGSLGESSFANKYYVDGNNLFTDKSWGLGLRMTHTVSPSLYYTLSYEYSKGSIRNIHGDERLSSDQVHAVTISKADVVAIKNTGGYVPDEWVDGNASDGIRDTTITLWLNDNPYGWEKGTENPLPDLPGVYGLTGGGQITDFSEWSFQKVRLDAFKQIGQHHGVKMGVSLTLNDFVKDWRRVKRSSGANGGQFSIYDAQPWQLGLYMQDKLEYEGLVAVLGVRADAYNASWWVNYADCTLFAPYWPSEMMGQGSFEELIKQKRDEGLARGDSTYYRMWDIYDKAGAAGGMNEYKTLVSVMDVARSHPYWKHVNDFQDLVPRARPKTWWKFAPRIGVSHPVGDATKFYFNFGWMYNLPETGWRYGIGAESFPVGYNKNDNRGIGNPNLGPPRTVTYEVGFEQSIQNTYVARVKGYSKDDTDKPVAFTYFPYDPVTGKGDEAEDINSTQNGAFLSRRGIELSLEKVQGRFWVGSLNMDYSISSNGTVGFSRIVHDSLNRSVAPSKRYATGTGDDRAQPSFWGNLILRTPHDYGVLKGDWSLSIRQSWSLGAKGSYKVMRIVGAPSVELRRPDTYYTDARLTKGFTFGKRSAQIYVSVANLFNYKTLNPNALDDNSYERYMECFTKRDEKTGQFISRGYRFGDSQFNEFAEQKLSKANDWLLYTGTPRTVSLGLRIAL